MPLRVEEVRSGMYGELMGEQFEVPVVDVCFFDRCLPKDGCLTFAPEDLCRVSVRGEVRAS